MIALIERLTGGQEILAWREREDGSLVVITADGRKRFFNAGEVRQAREEGRKDEPERRQRARPAAAG